MAKLQSKQSETVAARAREPLPRAVFGVLPDPGIDLIPIIRRVGPWGIAMTLNVGAAALVLTLSYTPHSRSIPKDSSPVIVFVVEKPSELSAPSASQKEVFTESEPNIAAAAPQPTATSIETPTHDKESSDPVFEQPNPTIPSVVLPETEQAGGGPEGVVGLSCYEMFDDPDKAAECAGRIVSSGWQDEVANLGGDWVVSADEMRRGVAVPDYGPDAYGDLARNETIYQPQDPRFQSNEFSTLGRYREAFETEAEYERFKSTHDPRSYVGAVNPAFSDQGTAISKPISGWRPSWTLREDPVIDNKALDEMARIAREADDNSR